MPRIIFSIGLIGFVLAGCATAPSTLDQDRLLSTLVDDLPAVVPDTSGRDQITSDIIGGATGGAGSVGGGAATLPSGFVYPAFGTAFASEQPATPYTMSAQGDAPYWRANVEVYERAGELFANIHMVLAEHDPILATLRPAADHMVQGFRRYVSDNSSSPAISAAFQSGPCVDASGIDRSFYASIRVDGENHDGCAREEGGQWDWSRDILSRYDMVLMCMDEVEGTIAAVDAYAPSELNTAVRVVTSADARFECVIVNDDRRLASVRELDATEVHLNEGRTLFLRNIPDAPNACRALEHIRSPEGELMGVLAHDLCQNPRIHADSPTATGPS
jgi:uncharacterized membrane protein